MNSDVKKKSVNATIWSGIDSISRQLIALIVNVILARLLSPGDFGLIGMLTIFIGLSNVFIECGFSNALIRKIDRTQADCSTTFYFNIIVGLFAYIVLLFLSPLIADFYSEPVLKPLLCIIGLNVFINSLCIVQNALLTANFNIRLQAQIQFISQTVTGIIAIVLAYSGWGVWALAFQSVASTSLRACLLWIKTKWKPTFEFSKESFRYLWNFGSKMLATGLISTFFNEINSVIIGKEYTKSDLGFYSRANGFARLIPDILNQVIQKVTIPTLAQFQNNISHLTDVYRKYIHIISFISIPSMFLLASVADPFVRLILTDKWESCILFLQILAIGLSISPIGTINMSLLQVLNRTDITLKIEIVKKILLVIIIVVSATMGLLPLVIGFAVYNIIATAINMAISKRMLNYGYYLQFMDIFKYLISALLIFIFVTFSISLFDNNILRLTIGCIEGLFLYAFFIKLFKLSAFDLLKGLIQHR